MKRDQERYAKNCHSECPRSNHAGSAVILLVRNIGANIVSVGASAENGVTCDLLSTPPALRHGNPTFPILTAIPRMYAVNIILDDVSVDNVDIYPTKIDAHMLSLIHI